MTHGIGIGYFLRPGRFLTRLWRLRQFAWMWFIGLVVFLALCIFPIKTTTTRSATILAGAALWIGLPGAFVRRRVGLIAFVTVGALVVAAAFLPGRPCNRTALRSAYVADLSSYGNVPYVWGGESRIGVDCSGLVRTAMVDACFWQGVKKLNPALIRRSAWIWWHDCSAADLGNGYGGNTMPVLKVKNIGTVESATIRAGDLAVLADGMHVMAYVGGGRWVEADPQRWRVVFIRKTDHHTVWTSMPARIVRWKDFQPGL